MKNNAAVAATSRGKDRANEKTYRISLSNGLLEHCPDMFDSVWLFIWYIDKTTDETNGEGTVLGGSPIRDPRPASALRMPVKTIRRWRLHLEEKGYIRTLRTPYGHVITLLKSKKWKRGPVLVSEAPDLAKRDLPNGEISPKENSQTEQSDFPKRAVRIPAAGSQISPNGKYKEDNAVDSTREDRDEAVEKATAAAELLLKRREEEPWKKFDLAPCGSEQFQKAWENIYWDSFTDERPGDVMERGIIACQKSGIVVPRAFFEAKRRVENNFSEDRSGTPSPPKQPYAGGDGLPTHEVPD